MAAKITSIKGMRDLFGAQLRSWRRMESVFSTLCLRRGYSEIRTPYLEATELFVRVLGEHTAVVGKEMYSFVDKKGLPLSLRPEGTASIVRAYIEAGLPYDSPHARFFYMGPMFRYEQPQKGRQRQFHQFGVELFGLASPAADVEVIALAHNFWRELGLTENISLLLNSVGCGDCRPAYIKALQAALQAVRDRLCADCKERILTNPLRVFDCKKPNCQAEFEHLPKIIDHNCDACRSHFGEVKRGLEALSIRYRLDPLLVRGLDYYTRTAFEWRAEGLGSQDALAGGGRYDRLVAELGGPQTPAIGFALGCERLLIALETAGSSAPASSASIDILPLDPESQFLALKLQAELLGATSYTVTVNVSGASLKTQLKQASKNAAQFVVIIGETERRSGEAMVKTMATGEQKSVAIQDLTRFFPLLG